MASITSEHTDLSVHWNSTVLRSQLTSTPEIDTILQLLSTAKTLYDPSHKHPNIEKQLRKVRQKSGEAPRYDLIRFQKKLVELEDAATISKNQSEYHIIGSVTEQVKQSRKGMDSEFKQRLKIQMRAREVNSFDSWARYLKLFVTAVQRAVHSDGDSPSDDINKDGKKKRRSLKTSQSDSERHLRICSQTASSPKTVSGQRTRVTVCFDLSKVRCPYGGQVFPQPCQSPQIVNRRLRWQQRTVRTHPKSERSKSRCASCLRRKIDCSQLRRRRRRGGVHQPQGLSDSEDDDPHTQGTSTASNSHFLWFPQLVLSELNATGLGSNQLGSTQLNSTWLNSTASNSHFLWFPQLVLSELNATRLGSNQLGPTQLNSTWLNSTRFNSAQLNLAQLSLAQLNLAQLNSTQLVMIGGS